MDLNFIDVLNKLSEKPFRVSKEALCEVNKIVNTKSLYAEYIIGTNQEMAQRHFRLLQELNEHINDKIYLSYRYDRRGRIHCLEYPINYQQVPLARYLLRSGRDIDVVMREINVFLSSLPEYDLYELLKNSLTELLYDHCYNTRFKNCVLPPEYLYKIFEILCLKVISYFEKILPTKDNGELLFKYEKTLIHIAKSDCSVEHILNLYNIQIDVSEYMNFWCVVKALRDYSRGELSNAIINVDAFGNVFQVHSVVNYV